ncbi:MAG: c-type cytochrome [Pseudomonadota bacterium]
MNGKMNLGLVALAGLFVAGCVVIPSNRTDAAHGQRLFTDKCAVCHGSRGEGAGVASLGLGAPPPSLRTLSERNGGTFPEAYVMAMIDGYDRRDQRHAAMPEFGAEGMGPIIRVENGDSVQFIPSDLLALTEYLRTLQNS